MHCRLMNWPMLTTEQYYLFMCTIYLKTTYIRIYCVCAHCQLTQLGQKVFEWLRIRQTCHFALEYRWGCIYDRTAVRNHNPFQTSCAPMWIYTLCVIHWEMLVSHKMSPELHSTLIDVVKTIKANALNSHLFWTAFWNSQVAFNEEILERILWVERANPEFVCFFQKKVTTGSTPQWRGMDWSTCVHVWHFKLADKVSAFKAKLQLWVQRVCFQQCFQHCLDIWERKKLDLPSEK